MMEFWISVVITVCSNRGNLHQLAHEKWKKGSDESKTSMARMAAAAAWGLGLFSNCYSLIKFVFIEKTILFTFSLFQNALPLPSVEKTCICAVCLLVQFLLSFNHSLLSCIWKDGYHSWNFSLSGPSVRRTRRNYNYMDCGFCYCHS